MATALGDDFPARTPYSSIWEIVHPVIYIDFFLSDHLGLVKMCTRKKVQKKKGKAKDLTEELDDVVENANDDGCSLSRKCITDIIRLIKCHTKPLNKVAAEFIEIFKERCSLIVGIALLSIYDELAPSNDAASRIVTIYLVYRVRDIELALRRRNPGSMDDILGHPFMSFFLNLVDSKVVDEICVPYPLPFGIERSIVLRILDGKTSEFANMSAIELLSIGTLNDSNRKCFEVEQYYVKQSARWPQHLDMVTIPSIFPYPDLNNHSYHEACIATQDTLLVSLMERISHEPLKQLPIKTTPLMPALYPIQPIELGCGEIDELRAKTAGSICAISSTSGEMDMSSTENASLGTLQASAQDLTKEQLTDFMRRLLDGKSLTQSETKQILKILERSDVSNDLITEFMQMSDSDLSRLIDLNVKIAIEVIDLCVSADISLANRVMRIVQGMDVTVQCMEVVTRLYQYRTELPREPLNDFVRYCIRYCLDATPSSNLNRVVRLVAITLKNLLKSGAISASELSLELREFGVRFCQHPDTTFLFSTVGLAQLKDSGESTTN